MLAEVSPTGTITSSRNYDVYGNVRSGVNANGTSAHKFVGNLGHPSDNNTGLIYMRARYMDPATGRFVSEDPGRHGRNWIVYCGGDPVNTRDPSGKVSLYDLNQFLQQLMSAIENPGPAFAFALYKMLTSQIPGASALALRIMESMGISVPDSEILLRAGSESGEQLLRAATSASTDDSGIGLLRAANAVEDTITNAEIKQYINVSISGDQLEEETEVITGG